MYHYTQINNFIVNNFLDFALALSRFEHQISLAGFQFSLVTNNSLTLKWPCTNVCHGCLGKVLQNAGYNVPNKTQELNTPNTL